MSAQIKERPIIFNMAMVQAIMNGSKSQSRRVIKPQPPNGYTFKGSDGGNPLLPNDSEYYWMNGYAIWRPRNKYQVGDRLWVRETWKKLHPIMDRKVLYKADMMAPDLGKPWRPSIHMPRWASRIDREITEVRVERVKDTTEEDAKAEGIRGVPTALGVLYKPAFSRLWDSINTKRGYSWESNPWVWVLTFKQMVDSL